MVHSSQCHLLGLHLDLFHVSNRVFNTETKGILNVCRFIATFLCVPVSDYWKIGSPEGSCIDEGVATLVCGIINCIADLATTITPLPLVMGLHMPMRQRLAVGTLFSLGMIVTVAGIIRTWFIYKSLIEEYDNTWYAFPLWIAAAVEIDLGVVSKLQPQLERHSSSLDLCIGTCPPTSDIQDPLQSVRILLYGLYAAQEERCFLWKGNQAFALPRYRWISNPGKHICRIVEAQVRGHQISP
jgi:hypothetical protein